MTGHTGAPITTSGRARLPGGVGPAGRPRGPRRVSRSGWLAAGVLAAAAGLVGACASPYEATPLPPRSAAPAQTPAPPSAGCPVQRAVASYAPPGSVPTDLTDYRTVRRIKERGRLVVGVSADTLLLGARNPINGRIEGFDVEMARLVARAVFGDPDRVQLRVITAAQRVPALRDGDVDLVARNMTITCDRWKQIAFSAEYYRSGQKVLVKRDARQTSLGELTGARVCAPLGSTSLEQLRRTPGVRVVTAGTHTECLVKFQQGATDAITGDDTVLAGLAAQDPYAKVVGQAFTVEPYGIGMKAESVDLVRYVNAVLARAVADGSWRAAYTRWLAGALGPAPSPPTPVYGRS
jgi:polar amino acid transport system substrate-binding protein